MIKYDEMMEKYEDKNDLVFPHVYHVCLTGRINNSFVWIRRKVGGYKIEFV